MFRSLRLAAASPAADHEGVFLARYTRLYDRALALTRDPALAEDLVQDAFVQFVLSRTPLDEIKSVDAYLFAMLQHMHVSQVRRAVRGRQSSLELLDHDSADIAFKGTDAASRYLAAEQLGLICEYACHRRWTSKTGSVLLLRFFHGYYLREIALLLRTPPSGVDGFLHLAKREARASLDNPPGLALMPARPGERPLQRGGLAAANCLNQLRSRVFNLAHQECLSSDWFERTYGGGSPDAVSCDHAAELVTCPRCLDAANRRLGLPLLADRFPTDVLGQDRRTGPGGGPGAATGDETGAKRLRRAASDVYEHHPRELMVAANGFMVASQRVGSTECEQRVSVNIAEPISFVEVFSDQQVRLAFLPVQPAPEGPVEQGARVELGDGRSTEVTVDASESWPQLRVLYRDPACAAEPDAAPAESSRSLEPVRLEPKASWWQTGGRRLLRLLTMTATALIAALAIWASGLFPGFPRLNATELLDRAAALEQTAGPGAAGVVHRILQVEERRLEDGVVLSRTRLEIYRDVATRTKAIRAYDDGTNTLKSLELVDGDGTVTLYRRSGSPQKFTSEALAVSSTVQADELWRLDPSPSTIRRLAGSFVRLDAGQSGSGYTIRCEGAAPGQSGGIIKAILTLSKTDMRVVSQVLTVGRNGRVREFRFDERSTSRLPSRPVGPDPFTPDDGLVPPASRPDTVGKPPLTALEPLGGDEVAELEVEALYLLNQAGATLGEQVSVAGDSGGVRVEAVVGSPERKRAILGSLAPLMGRRSVAVDVMTVREAASRRSGARRTVTVQDVAPNRNHIAAYQDLLGYLLEHPDPSWPAEPGPRQERVEREVVLFATRMLDRSGRALQRAFALEHLVALVPPQQASRLGEAAQNRWRSMIREHAAAFLQETTALRIDLAPVFGPFADRPPDAPVLRSEGAGIADAIRAVLRLAQAEDEAVRSAFAVQTGASAPSLALKSAAFWDGVLHAESLARSLANVQ